MTKRLLPVCVVAGFAMVAAARPPGAQNQESTSTRWYKGNTHTHTLNSDGDSTPDEVVRWYREHGYKFLVLTDHNVLTASTASTPCTAPTTVPRRQRRGGHRHASAKADAHQRARRRRAGRPRNGVVGRRRAPARTSTPSAAPTACRTSTIRTSAGRSRPTNSCRCERTRLFEIFNGHPQVNNLGGGGVPGLEEVWDRLLIERHADVRHRGGRCASRSSRPGNPLARARDAAGCSSAPSGWTPGARRGDRARGLLRVDRRRAGGATRRRRSGITIDGEGHDLEQVPGAVHRPERPGPVGATTPAASYTFKGDEGYVRAQVLESNGYAAWTQPVPVGAGGPKVSQ